MEMLQGVWKQHLRPRAVVGYGVKIFLPSPPNYVTRSPGFIKLFFFFGSSSFYKKKKTNNGNDMHSWCAVKRCFVINYVTAVCFPFLIPFFVTAKLFFSFIFALSSVVVRMNSFQTHAVFLQANQTPCRIE